MATKYRTTSRQVLKTYMLVAGMIGQLATLIQAYKTYSTQSAHDLSLAGFSIGLFSAISWLTYGLVLKDNALIFSNIIGFLASSLVILGIFLYG